MFSSPKHLLLLPSESPIWEEWGRPPPIVPPNLLTARGAKALALPALLGEGPFTFCCLSGSCFLEGWGS